MDVAWCFNSGAKENGEIVQCGTENVLEKFVKLLGKSVVRAIYACFALWNRLNFWDFCENVY